MPKIQVYENPIKTIRPSETGVEATAATARRSGQFFRESANAEHTLAQETSRFGSEVAQAGRTEAHMYETAVGEGAQGLKEAGDVAVDYLGHQNVLGLSTAYVGLRAGIDDAWNKNVKQIMSDPTGTALNDPTIQARFMKQVQPDLDKFREGAWTEAGRNFADNRVEALQNHLFEKTTADMGRIAGAQVEVGIKTQTNTLATMVAKDPTALQSARDDVDALVDHQIAQSRYLKGGEGVAKGIEIKQAMKETLTRSAGLSAIMNSNDPVATADAFTNNPENAKYLMKTEAEQFAKTAQAQQRMNLAAEKSAQYYQKQMNTLHFNGEAAKLIGSLIGPDGRIIPATKQYWQSIKQLSFDPGATRESISALFNFGAKNEKGVTDPITQVNLQTKLYQGDLSPLEIIHAANDGKLSKQDATVMEQQRKLVEEHVFKDPAFESVMKAVQSRLIDTSAPDNDPIGHGNMAKFTQQFLPQYIKMKAGEKGVPANALDFNDPSSMVRKMMAPFDTSLNEKMKTLAAQRAAEGHQENPEVPPYEGARKAPDGKWYVQKNGKYYPVVQGGQ